MKVTTRWDLSGPFFSRDPKKTIRANIREMLQALADEGEDIARSQVGSHSREVPDYIKGRVHAVSGKPWHLNAVVGVSPASFNANRGTAIRVMAKMAGRRQGNRGVTLGIEARYRIFRRLTSSVRRYRKHLANLAKGLG